jgi:hypothetical protein
MTEYSKLGSMALAEKVSSFSQRLEPSILTSVAAVTGGIQRASKSVLQLLQDVSSFNGHSAP